MYYTLRYYVSHITTKHMGATPKTSAASAVKKRVVVVKVNKTDVPKSKADCVPREEFDAYKRRIKERVQQMKSEMETKIRRVLRENPCSNNGGGRNNGLETALLGVVAGLLVADLIIDAERPDVVVVHGAAEADADFDDSFTTRSSSTSFSRGDDWFGGSHSRSKKVTASSRT